MRKAMISQPMRGLTHEQISEQRAKAADWLMDHGYMVIDSYFHGDNKPEPVEGMENEALYYLSASLCCMSTCDTLFCCKGWENARGCILEHDAAKAYGLNVIEEESV